MKPGTDYAANKPRKILLIGNSGSGKSNFCLDLPDPYILDFDANLINAVERHPGKTFWFDSVERDDKDQTVPIDKQWKRSMELMKLNGPRPEVKFIVADGLTRMSDLLQAYLVEVGGEAERVITIGGLKTMNQSLWGAYARHMRDFLRLATSFGKPFLLTCHIKIDDNELTSIKEQLPNVGGKMMLSEIVGWFTDYILTDTEPDSKSKTGVAYILRTAPTTRIQLKNSLGLPPKLVVSPDSADFKAMLAKLNAGCNGAPAVTPAVTPISPAPAGK